MDDTTVLYSYSTSTGTSGETMDPAFVGVMIAVYVVIMILTVILIISQWKLFAKAGKPGWASIVPIYNFIVMLEIVGRPVWWVALLFVPFVNIVIEIMLILDLAKAYGKSSGYGVLMLLFPYIMFPVLAFSKDTKYVGPVAAGVVPQPMAQPQYGPAPAAPAQPAAPQPPVNPGQPQQ